MDAPQQQHSPWSLYAKIASAADHRGESKKKPRLQQRKGAQHATRAERQAARRGPPSYCIQHGMRIGIAAATQHCRFPRR